MEEYIKWLENKIEVCLEDKDLQREHWAFCQALKKYRELALRQTAVSGSALIAEFMKDEQCAPYWINLRAGVEGEYYTTSWNWLMPVLEKICRLKIGDGIKTVDYPNLRTFGMINEETGGIMVRLNGFRVFEAETLIEATLLSVVDFLEWWSKADR
jgi:hypothetical protein